MFADAQSLPNIQPSHTFTEGSSEQFVKSQGKLDKSLFAAPGTTSHPDSASWQAPIRTDVSKAKFTPTAALNQI